MSKNQIDIIPASKLPKKKRKLKKIAMAKISKIKFVKVIPRTQFHVDFDINRSKLYQGCNKSKWDYDGARFRRHKSFNNKIDKIGGVRRSYKSLSAAKRIANKLIMIPEIKRVIITQTLGGSLG